MNVLVLCTGRCGLTTLVEPCRHICRCGVAQEPRTRRLAAERRAHPARRFQVDSRVSWFLGPLDRTYSAAALHVFDPHHIAG